MIPLARRASFRNKEVITSMRLRCYQDFEDLDNSVKSFVEFALVCLQISYASGLWRVILSKCAVI